MAYVPDFHYLLCNEPEKVGLEQVAYVTDPQAFYDFHDVGVWRRLEDEALFYGEDSGCSCPSPFENVHKVEDLEPLTAETYQAFTEVLEQENYRGEKEFDPVEVAKVLLDVQRLLGIYPGAVE